ncbi:hypothetical protein TBR22_A28850 [Luteitalea sp. TBR-22]|uniref:hypothetical protein n=1 Tax=Luteitalea sp. TBR-22 TaxID=2802971 RepID=UPI001AFBAEEC|nr:hypothetical protein [Luteitalea sp. TBR-22]BCS33658.1 hypothetical protein TBR22_A28850 [Luteitalea sp. TBR-22]
MPPLPSSPGPVDTSTRRIGIDAFGPWSSSCLEPARDVPVVEPDHPFTDAFLCEPDPHADLPSLPGLAGL